MAQPTDRWVELWWPKSGVDAREATAEAASGAIPRLAAPLFIKEGRSPHRGTFFADAVRVGAGAKVQYVPLVQ